MDTHEYCKDITLSWKRKTKIGEFIKKSNFIINDVEYTVDDIYIYFDTLHKEADIGIILCKLLKCRVEMLPKVNYPTGIRTPDFIIDGEKFELKLITGIGKSTFSNAICKEQANNYIFDISNNKLNIGIIYDRVEKLYTNICKNFLIKVIIIKDGKILKIYERTKKYEK